MSAMFDNTSVVILGEGTSPVARGSYTWYIY